MPNTWEHLFTDLPLIIFETILFNLRHLLHQTYHSTLYAQIWSFCWNAMKLLVLKHLQTKSASTHFFFIFYQVNKITIEFNDAKRLYVRWRKEYHIKTSVPSLSTASPTGWLSPSSWFHSHMNIPDSSRSCLLPQVHRELGPSFVSWLLLWF